MRTLLALLIASQPALAAAPRAPRAPLSIPGVRADVQRQVSLAPGAANLGGERIAIVAAQRTPYTPFNPAAAKDAKALGAEAISDTLKAAGLSPETLEKLAFDGERVKIVYGAVDNSSNPNIGRELAVKLGMPSVPGTGVCKNCGTSLESVAMGASLLRSGDADVIVAGGAEAMSQFPLWTKDPGLRRLELGLKILKPGVPKMLAWVLYQQKRLTTRMRYAITEGLAVDGVSMAGTAQTLADDFGISRDRQDWFAYESQRKAAAAAKRGDFENETSGRGVDGGIRWTASRKGLRKLKGVLGTKDVTAGNASQMTDGASAVLMMTESKAKKLGLVPLAYLASSAEAAVDPKVMGLGPAYALPMALKRAGATVNDLAVLNINEAFAAQTLAVLDVLGLKASQINPQGGAIARGHPLAASGAGLLATTLHGMLRHDKEWGACTACIGGGEGQALVIRRRPNGIDTAPIVARLRSEGVSEPVLRRVEQTIHGLPGAEHAEARSFLKELGEEVPEGGIPGHIALPLSDVASSVKEDKKLFGQPKGSYYRNFKIGLDGYGVAAVAFSRAPVNALNQEVGEELKAILRRLTLDTRVKSIVLIGEGSAFVAGADLNLVGAMKTAEDGRKAAAELQSLFQAFENSPKPVVIALNGKTMGGGLELAMAGHYRMAAAEAEMGLPEVGLGLLPGAGGTQRLPRLVGLTQALTMMNSAAVKDAYTAKKMGLVDEVVPSAELLHRARLKARELSAVRKTLDRPVKLTLVERIGMMFNGYLIRRAVRKETIAVGKADYLPNIMKIIDVTLEGVRHGPVKGLAAESKGFGELSVRPMAKFMTQLALRAFGGPKAAAAPLPVDNVAVVGAGVMGSGIAQLSLQSGLPVMLKDMKQEALDTAEKRIRKLYEGMVAKDKLSPDAVEEKMSMLTGYLDDAAFAASKPSIVVEAIIENEKIKTAFFSNLGKQMPPETIFATNTSALSVTKLAHASGRPGKFIGLHYFNPPHKLKLVEIILPDTAGFTPEQLAEQQQTLATALVLMKKQGRLSVVVKDAPGFVVNRMLVPYGDEAARLLEEGATIAQVDAVMKKLGFPMGPIELVNFVGVPLSIEVGAYLEKNLPHLGQMSTLLRDVKTLDEKNVRERHRRRSVSDREIEERLLFLLANEGARILGEGVAASPADIDMALTAGAGFPVSMGGLMRHVEAMGWPYVAGRLRELAKKRGTRYEPADWIKARSS